MQSTFSVWLKLCFFLSYSMLNAIFFTKCICKQTFRKHNTDFRIFMKNSNYDCLKYTCRVAYTNKYWAHLQHQIFKTLLTNFEYFKCIHHIILEWHFWSASIFPGIEFLCVKQFRLIINEVILHVKNHVLQMIIIVISRVTKHLCFMAYHVLVSLLHNLIGPKHREID